MSNNSKSQTNSAKILITGAAGNLGSIGPKIVKTLLAQGFPVRAFVRKQDNRSEALEALGAEIFVGDLTQSSDVVKAVEGCSRIYFSMSVSEYYLEASLIMAAAAREQGNVEVLVNMSQMTVSEMSLTKMTNSRQQRLHWLSEQAFNWSGLPTVHLRPTVFMDGPFFTHWAAISIDQQSELRLPLGTGKSSPIAAQDVAAVASTVLANPSGHIGKVYELTGPISQDLHGAARAYSEALEKDIKYIAMPFDEWYEQARHIFKLPDHTYNHIREMARLHGLNRYDRYTNKVKELTGREPTSIQEYVRTRPEVFHKNARL
ncbi:hydroxylase [Umbelopsis sp. PMI_123]|nr:hydroxylase [Umbelopsis sp. PMI_123]